MLCACYRVDTTSCCIGSKWDATLTLWGGRPRPRVPIQSVSKSTRARTSQFWCESAYRTASSPFAPLQAAAARWEGEVTRLRDTGAELLRSGALNAACNPHYAWPAANQHSQSLLNDSQSLLNDSLSLLNNSQTRQNNAHHWRVDLAGPRARALPAASSTTRTPQGRLQARLQNQEREVRSGSATVRRGLDSPPGDRWNPVATALCVGICVPFFV